MKTLSDLTQEARNWFDATNAPPKVDWFSFPYLGSPWDHTCSTLRSKSISVSVIIPFWNSASSLTACLASLRFSSLNRIAPDRLEILLCDDGSSDNSWAIALAAAKGMNVRAFQLPHHSQSAAINFAFDHAGNDVVVLCDSDMIVGCGALDELAARHEQFPSALCFGFRTDIFPPDVPFSSSDIWLLIHQEAFSGDVRVHFDLPTLEPNLLVATDWLQRLYKKGVIIDSDGLPWSRHRFVFGCLFSSRRDLFEECNFFPDSLQGWGFSDTLVAARLEAAGAFLLPVTSAWGHHVNHSNRDPGQWFQGSRNYLAYEYFMDHPPSDNYWRSNKKVEPLAQFSYAYELDDLDFVPRVIDYSSTTIARLGHWQECLQQCNLVENAHTMAECLFRLGQYNHIVENSHLALSIWGVLGLQRLGKTNEAQKMLHSITESDIACRYLSTASIPELLRLAENYQSIGLDETGELYMDAVAIIS